MQELQVIEEKKIEQIYNLVNSEDLTRESFESDLINLTQKYKGYIATASTLKDDKVKRAEFNKIVEAKNRIRIDTKNLLSETANTWNDYAKSLIDPFEKVVSDLDKSIKDIEEHQKAVRLDTVKSYLANKAAEYLLDPRIFDEKALEYIKAGDFMADGVTLKKITMKSLDDMVTFEYQKKQEAEQAQSAIKAQCEEYGMPDSPYLRQLRDLTLVEVLEQIKADYAFEQEKRRVAEAEAERERQEAEKRRQEAERERRIVEERQKEQEPILKSQETRLIDPETGEIIEGVHLPQESEKSNTGHSVVSERYTRSMAIEVYFKNDQEKDKFKQALADLGFEYLKNYSMLKKYRLIEPVTDEELENQLKSNR